MKPAIHHHNFLSMVHTLEPLIRRHAPLRRMSFDDLTGWLVWYWNRGTMTCVISNENEPRGICLIRLFRSLDQMFEPDVHDPCGKFCFIELSVADDGKIMGWMLEELEGRWGPQEIMVWDRGARTENSSPRMYCWSQFVKLARRLSNVRVHA